MYNYENEFRIVFIENNKVTDVTFLQLKKIEPLKNNKHLLI